MPVRTARYDDTAVITLDRVERRNAVDAQTLEEIAEAFSTALSDEVRCIIVTGADGHFCAGADLTELEDLQFTERFREVLDSIADAPVPVIAAVSGACMGLGLQLALASDVVVATDDAYFGIPVAKLGLMVDHWTLQRLAIRMGSGQSRAMLLTAEVVKFDRAHELGFVQQEGTLGDAIVIGERVAGLAPLSISGTKLGLNLIEPRLEEAQFRAAFVAAWQSEDLIEGRTAFKEKRSPRFKGY